MRFCPLVHATIAVLLGVVGAVASPVRADFEPPKDGKLTEKQLTNYIDVKRDQFAAMTAAAKAADGTKSSAAGLAIYSNLTEKMDAAITKHGMTKPEFDWVDGVVGKSWMYAFWAQQWDDYGKPDIEKQIKDKETERDAAKAKLADYEKANKDGKRILTKEQRDAAVQSATSDRDSATSDVKDKQDAVKQVQDEIKQHEKEAADADALAKNPPAEVSADDRPGYVEGKKNEAQTARDAAKEAGDRLKEAQKNLDDAKTKLATTNDKLAHPEMPQTDDEKTQVKAENERAIADAKSTIDGDEQGISALKETLSGGPPMLAQMMKADEKDKPDPDNLALMKKHIKEYLSAIGQEKMWEVK
jgi:hypothetical protein